MTAEPTEPAGGGTARPILGDEEIARALVRMAHQVAEVNRGTGGMVVLGIPTRGVPLAHRLAGALQEIDGAEVPVGELDVTMYRDDLRRHPTRPVGRSTVPGGVEGKVVLLVDDVLNSGRTVLAALDALKDLGRPQRVLLAVLVDRGHREVPVQADVTGLSIGTAKDERVVVHLAEHDGRDVVLIQRGASATGQAEAVSR